MKEKKDDAETKRSRSINRERWSKEKEDKGNGEE
jgi:hypothetical protein